VQLCRLGLDWAVASPAASDETQRRTHGTARTRACRHPASIRLPTSTTRPTRHTTDCSRAVVLHGVCVDGWASTRLPCTHWPCEGRWKARSGQVRPRRVRYLPTYRARRLAYSTVGNGRQALVLNTPPSPRRTCTCSASITSSMATATTHQTHLADQTRPHQTRPDPSPHARCA
jgi:hypothetical protein